MRILHQCTVPDTPENTDVSSLYCVHCDKQMTLGDAFTIRDDGYSKRHEFTPCTEVKSND